MLQYLQQFFTIGAWYDLALRVVLVVIASAVLFVMFYYAKKRNLVFITVLNVVALLGLFVMSFFGIDNLPFYVYFVLGFFTVADFGFFTQDFRRDIFRRAWHRYVSMDNQSFDVGREELSISVDSIVKACQHMSKTDTGALIVIADNISDGILESGTRLNAVVTSDLLETVFFPKTPLHDGAVIITGNKIVAASCYLPLTQNLNLPREFGTRHRAAIGITEHNPSLTAIVVSEESGIISAMHDGKVKRYLDAETLTRVLECAMRLTDSEEEDKLWGVSNE